MIFVKQRRTTTARVQKNRPILAVFRDLGTTTFFPEFFLSDHDIRETKNYCTCQEEQADIISSFFVVLERRYFFRDSLSDQK